MARRSFIEFMRDFGGKVALSAAASATAAGMLMLPGFVSDWMAKPASPRGDQQLTLLTSVPMDGKLHDRLGEMTWTRPGIGEIPPSLPPMPRMPMTVAWEPANAPAPTEPVTRAAEAPKKAQPARVASAPRAPLPIVPAVQRESAPIAATPVAQAESPGLVDRAGSLVGGAAGLVGSAGGWAWDKARGLVPW